MPVGIYLIVHDEIKGPQIKTSYFENIIDLPQEFISKLYMTHAGFESSSTIEIKFNRFKNVSKFTGSLDRRTKKEGIMGILFEEDEEHQNLDFFFQRNLSYAIDNPNEETMEDIFTNKLSRYLELSKIFNKVEIERIPELFIIHGDTKFKSYSLKVGDSQISNAELSEIFEKISKSNDISPYNYKLLQTVGKNKIYLIMKFKKPDQDTDKLFSTLYVYLKQHYDFAMEIVSLVLLSSVVGIFPLNNNLGKKYSNKSKSVFEIISDSKKSNVEFDNIIISMINEELYLTPLL